jgi:YHYH protein
MALKRSAQSAGVLCLVAVFMGSVSACSQTADVSSGSTSGSSPAPSTNAATNAATTADIPSAWSAIVDPTAIPIGDGHVSTSPAVGELYSCKTTFGGRGVSHGGPWIDEASGTWDSTTKISVQGSNTWPQAFYKEVVSGDERTITTADLPTTQVTGTFPIANSDPAKQYDPNPNSIQEKSVSVTLPLNPDEAAQPSCVGMGAIGVLLNGVYVYNAIDAAGGDAAAHETQDVCDGHPDGGDYYHYHDIPSCILDAIPATGSTLVGYALDGFGIYVERDAMGNLPTNADLDVCHGRTSTVLFDGTETTMYHYSATMEFPYTVGCYRGTPVQVPTHE